MVQLGLLLLDAIPDGATITIPSSNLNLTISKGSAAALAALPIEAPTNGGGAATVQLPDSVVDFFGKGGGGGALDAAPGLNLTEGAKLGAIMYTTNAPPGAYGGVTPSQLVSFSLATPADPESDDPAAEESSGEISSGEDGSGEVGSGDESSGEEKDPWKGWIRVPVSNLPASDPIVISIPRAPGCDPFDLECVPTESVCMFWQGRSGGGSFGGWGTRGCVALPPEEVGSGEGGSGEGGSGEDGSGTELGSGVVEPDIVRCGCTHLTDFVAFEFPMTTEELLEDVREGARINTFTAEQWSECLADPQWDERPFVFIIIIAITSAQLFFLCNAVRRDRRELAFVKQLVEQRDSDKRRRRARFLRRRRKGFTSGRRTPGVPPYTGPERSARRSWWSGLSRRRLVSEPNVGNAADAAVIRHRERREENVRRLIKSANAAMEKRYPSSDSVRGSSSDFLSGVPAPPDRNDRNQQLVAFTQQRFRSHRASLVASPPPSPPSTPPPTPPPSVPPLPLLFATECLANLCGETVASVLSVAFDTLFVFLSKLAHPA